MPRIHSLIVVDDDVSFRNALVALLDSMDYDAQGFASAEAFLAARADISCDCVITDVHMPGMNGFDLQRLLLSCNSKVPMIMITARAEPGLEAQALASGATCLLKKPFESGALIACIEAALKP
ncbi:response regulator [Starkeya sp. ORNL1]|uniref:response regulator transcription factor n=1 Tax=Starkeya sp. ORNL1 TaxID=2709380 RepID=UPI001462885B|nr:response regulator [Starkeya sp. ORNL1]QJP14784.1 response regulator [Starkeya sp. ORNL1]